MMNYFIEIKNRAKVGGSGGFAKEDIPKGAKLLTFQGEKVNRKEVHRRIIEGIVRKDDPLQIGEDEFLVLDDDAYFINHCCDPNTILSGDADLLALKDIKKGEEITYDYSSVVGTNVSIDSWTMECHCGSGNCRKIIGNVLTLPKEQLDYYIKSGGLQLYIRKQLNIL